MNESVLAVSVLLQEACALHRRPEVTPSLIIHLPDQTSGAATHKGGGVVVGCSFHCELRHSGQTVEREREPP